MLPFSVDESAQLSDFRPRGQATCRFWWHLAADAPLPSTVYLTLLGLIRLLVTDVIAKGFQLRSQSCLDQTWMALLNELPSRSAGTIADQLLCPKAATKTIHGVTSLSLARDELWFGSTAKVGF